MKEGSMKNDECWRMNDEGWWFDDKRTNERTLENVESLLWLKRQTCFTKFRVAFMTEKTTICFAFIH